ncbi:HEPN domain-containing protein [Parafilimonas sp.]|uniref:HEPN domain-containing protein n=1 Tax=Parafilimonas sp. TaxID=1969739 RepID=UPI003F7FBAFE
MYYLLTERFKEQEAKLVEIIQGACSPVKIFLLGSSLISRRTETVFMADAPTCSHVGHYYVLVVINSLETNSVQDKIENRCKNFIPTTAVILNENRFDKWIMEGHPFVRTVYERAVMLYGEKEKRLLPDTSNAAAIEKENNEIYTAGLNKAEEFLAGAELYRIRSQNKMAAFMLHQAAEQSLITLLKLKTGWHVNTHNLDKLYRYCCMVCYKLPELIFGNNKDRNKQLFHLLQRAYVEARYRGDYNVNAFEVKTMEEMVKRVYEVLENPFVCPQQ